MIKKSNRRDGFTLIELMIVVAIIGILAAVAIPKFADLVTKSKESAVKATVGSIRSAVSIYYGDTEGTYPGNLFVGLTTSNKYLPALSNVPSLGKIEIPQHANNTGHTSALYSNASAAGAVVNSATTDDSTPLYYISASGFAGVNCSHQDTKGNLWSAF